MDKNSIIGFVLIGLVLLGFSFYQSSQYKKQMEAQAVADSIARVEMMEKMAMDSVLRAEEIVSDAVVTPGKQLARYKDSLLTSAQAGEATYHKLENDKIEVVFTTKGAQPYSVKVKDYKTYDSCDLYLVKPGYSDYGISIYAGENINTRDFIFDVTESSDSVLVMRLPFVGGGCIEQRYSLSEGSYMVDNRLAFRGMENVIPRNVSMFDIDWNLMIPRLEKGYKNESQYSKLDYYFPDTKKPEEFGRGRSGEKRADARLEWFAFQQQFFSAIMTAGNEFSSGEFKLRFCEENDPDRNLMACSARMRSDVNVNSAEVEVPFSFYFGPNHFSTLKHYDRKYEKIIPLGGWLVNWISRYVIIPCFNFLGRFINNYGIIILLMTILIKIVVSPFTIKSYMSSAKMNAIKPEVDKLNEKYPKEQDAMKKQQAMMDLYKRAGISPMGGCLPMLLQFPILFAMFRFFPASIELRQQRFLWAEDLSAYDSILDLPFNIPLYGDHISLFALLMAISMFLYSKMTSSQMSNDPNMAGMKFMSVWMMPIMMLFICNNLSSGLSYYYLLSNLITMLQTWFISKFVVDENKIRA
ncbi:MAG: membrane protein insertase YidC, partial [Candidatus Cryptobacteroides sp.]